MFNLVTLIDYSWNNNITLFNVIPNKHKGYFYFRNSIIYKVRLFDMCNKNLNRENLINIINRCNNEAIKKQWILELASLTDVECSESQCQSCLIAKDCLDTLL